MTRSSCSWRGKFSEQARMRNSCIRLPNTCRYLIPRKALRPMRPYSIMKYALTTSGEHEKKQTLRSAFAALSPLLSSEKKNLLIALAAVFISSASNLAAPALIARVIDTAIAARDFSLVLEYSGTLLMVYFIGLGA